MEWERAPSRNRTFPGNAAAIRISNDATPCRLLPGSLLFRVCICPMKRPNLSPSNFIGELRFPKKTQKQAIEHRRKQRRAARQSDRGPRWSFPFSWPRITLWVSVATLLSFLLCIHLLPNRVAWKMGDVAEWDIIAPRTIPYEDTAATARLREDAGRQVEERYDPIPGARTAALDRVSTIFDRIEDNVRATNAPPVSATAPKGATSNPPPGTTTPTPVAKPATPKTIQERAREIAALINRDLGTTPSQEDLVRILSVGETSRQEARTIVENMVKDAMARAITSGTDDLNHAREDLFRNDSLKTLEPRELRDSIASIAGMTLIANRRLNRAETENARQTAQGLVQPAIRRLTAGSLVIEAGERVTQQHLDQFAALGLQNSRLDGATIATISLLVFLLVGLTTVYIRQFHPELYADLGLLLLLSIVTVISVLGLKIGSALLGLSAVPGVHFEYLGMMCVASAGMVIGLLISPRVALLIVALLSIASGLVLNNELRFTVITLGSSLVGILCVSTLKNRGDLLRATLVVCGSNAVLSLLVGQLEGNPFQEGLMGVLWGVVSGVFALALFYFGVAAFEKPFGITTHLRLLELTDPATPILQEFRLKVPGTYAHSLMVSNLAHAAAEAIGADALLVRVAAYYHDLGKMNRPEFFIENQSNAENIHDRISPSLSAIILASHVKEGVEIAQEIGLPPRVRELIQQHHGTSLMKYFYHRATGGLPDPTLEAQFRYAGPKPQSKEAAILMIADSVEAASRTIVRPTPQRIVDFVARIIEDKRADGQLDECDLTLTDMKVIQDAIARTLSGALHARVEYPGTPSTSRGNTDSMDNTPAGVPSLTKTPERTPSPLPIGAPKASHGNTADDTTQPDAA